MISPLTFIHTNFASSSLRKLKGVRERMGSVPVKVLRSNDREEGFERNDG